MGYCSCGNWVDEGGICSHCGSALTYEDPEEEDEDIKKSNGKISRREYFYRKARTYSIKGDHITAIKFYKEVLRLSAANSKKCEALTELALEYETIGDDDSEEWYWNEACRTAEDSTVHVYLCEKGDFLYERGRYEEAISTYEEALKSLSSLKSTSIISDELVYYAKIVHYIIASYDQLEMDNHKEEYHNALKNGIDRYIQARPNADDEYKADYISRYAWTASEREVANEEALILIDYAFKLKPHLSANDYNMKAIILQRCSRYDEALEYYAKAISKDPANKTFLENKANCIRDKLYWTLLFHRTQPEDLDLINEALKILPKGCDNSPYLTTKAKILDQLGEPVKSRICLALAGKHYDEVDRAEKQLKKLKSSQNYINITSTQFYRDFEPFHEGTIVDLVREPDNPHDRFAIRVEIDGETVGYVANSEYTLIKEVKSARALKHSKSTQAEVQFILFNKWVIAKLI